MVCENCEDKKVECDYCTKKVKKKIEIEATEEQFSYMLDGFTLTDIDYIELN